MKILQIAYYFPPMGGAGVQRALKFAKFLPEWGIEPLVLAAEDPTYVQDPSLLAELPPGLRVERVADTSWLRRWVHQRHLREVAAQGDGAAVRAAGPEPSAAPARARSGRRPLAAAQAGLRDAALRAYATMRFPDDMAVWSRRAEHAALRLVREHDIELVFSSSPPASVHRLAARVAEKTGLPWVADLRDLWTDNPGYALPGWRRALDRRLEDRWLRQAAGVVTVTPSWRDMLAERIGPGSRVAFIPNGYDEADFASRPASPSAASPAADHGRDDIFRVVHTGTFYGPRDPGALLAGVSRYLDQAGKAHRRLRLRLVGNIGARFAAALASFEAEHPGVIERVAYLPHRQAIEEMENADALLLVVGGDGSPGPATRGWLPGKLFEYLRVGKPVLLLGDPEGDCARLVREHTCGEIADPSDPGRVAAALRALVDSRNRPRMPASRDVARFERRRLAGELADFLRTCR